MKYFAAEIAENEPLGGGYFRLGIDGCEALGGARPGQFVMLRGDWDRDPLLPRAFSLLSVDATGRARILAKTVGRGTALLERALPGTSLSLLGPLGTCFPAPDGDHLDLLVAGGVGLPPIHLQAQAAHARGVGGNSEVLYGGRTGHDLVLLDTLRGYGVGLFLTTEDGTVGRSGLVTAELSRRLRQAVSGEGGRARNLPGAAPNIRIMACGPNPMLWAVAAIAKEHGVACFLSVEEQMACGIGVCLGCAVPAHTRPFRYVCKDGPVFDATELVMPPPAAPPSHRSRPGGQGSPDVGLPVRTDGQP